MLEGIIKVIILLMFVNCIYSTSLESYILKSEKDPQCTQTVESFREFYYKVPEEIRIVLSTNLRRGFIARYPHVERAKIDKLVSMFCNRNFHPLEVCRYSREILRPRSIQFIN